MKRSPRGWRGRRSRRAVPACATISQSRPVIAEVEAITRAAVIARETGAKLHIVHVSSGSGVTAALEARARGADISIETCAHYLFFTEDDACRLGAVAKCAPPLGRASERDALWDRLRAGRNRCRGIGSFPRAAFNEDRRGFLRHLGRHRRRAIHACPCCSTGVHLTLDKSRDSLLDLPRAAFSFPTRARSRSVTTPISRSSMSPHPPLSPRSTCSSGINKRHTSEQRSAARYGKPSSAAKLFFMTASSRRRIADAL